LENEKWKFEGADGQIKFAPVIGPGPDNTVYIVTNMGTIFAINPSAPNPAKWSRNIAGAKSPVIDSRGILYVPVMVK
jgi:hypothetical protein